MRKTLLSAVLFSFAAVFCCTGCGNEAAVKKNTLTVCVEQEYSDEISDVLELWEALHPDREGELIVLPEDSDTRKIKISGIRTELMAGGGPDVFFLSSKETDEAYEMLFAYPEKMMYADTFLPLDDLLLQTEYAHPEKWNQKILEAGKTDKGQMLLPLFYHYDSYAFPKADVKSEEIPASWEELRTCENAMVHGVMYMQTYRFYPLFSRLADFKEGVPAVTKEEIQKRADEAVEFIWNMEQQETDTEGVITGPAFYEMLSAAEEEMSIAGFPNAEGGITAYVDAYTGVNRNTKKSEEAFSFLDLLFSDEVLGGSGMIVGEKTMGQTLYYNAGSLVIYNPYRTAKFPGISEENMSSLDEIEKRISAVCFYSDLETDLEEMFWRYFQSCHKGEDRLMQTELVSKLYETMQMKIAE